MFPGLKCCVTGRNGFIGSALTKALIARGAIVTPILSEDVDICFHFGSSSSNDIFNRNLDYAARETIDGFINVLSFCKENDIKLVYPSSATVYNKNTAYSRCKAILEDIVTMYNYPDVLGLRIAAGYGPGEAHKGPYASVIHQWCLQMLKGESPVIYGDGEQTRDFIFIDDIIESILYLVGKKATGFHDVGTGINYRLKDVVTAINVALATDIKPVYIEKPAAYVEHTPCKSAILPAYSLQDGINKTIQCLFQ